jgi:hypothetical protein
MLDTIDIATPPPPIVNLTFRPVLTARGAAVLALIRRNWLRGLSAADRRAEVTRLWIDAADLTDADYLYLCELVAAHQGA